jgi:hypothetical protein
VMGLIRGLAFDVMGLIRGLAYARSGIIKLGDYSISLYECLTVLVVLIKYVNIC